MWSPVEHRVLSGASGRNRGPGASPQSLHTHRHPKSCPRRSHPHVSLGGRQGPCQTHLQSVAGEVATTAKGFSVPVVGGSPQGHLPGSHSHVLPVPGKECYPPGIFNPWVHLFLYRSCVRDHCQVPRKYFTPKSNLKGRKSIDSQFHCPHPPPRYDFGEWLKHFRSSTVPTCIMPHRVFIPTAPPWGNKL